MIRLSPKYYFGKAAELMQIARGIKFHLQEIDYRLTDLSTMIKNGITQTESHSDPVAVRPHSVPMKDCPLQKGRVLNRDWTPPPYPITEARKKYFMAKYDSLEEFHFPLIRSFFESVEVQGKKVLEVGGFSYPEELVCDEFGAERWVCADQTTWNYKTSKSPFYKLEEIQEQVFKDRFAIFAGDAENIGKRMENRFDVVFSCCCFEHVLNFAAMLEVCYHSLKPGGVLWASFAPIWSGPEGSHYWIDKDDNFSRPRYMKHWMHLTKSPPELYEYLDQFYDDKSVLRRVVFCTYHRELINRLYFEDYLHYLAISPFSHYTVTPQLSAPPPPDLQKELEWKNPGYRRFDANGITIHARK